jgi:arylsulfatase A-like enzyme
MNVIVLVNDSWRFDHLGCYGNEWIKTPRIDEFASESAQFNRCYSEGLPTIPTRTTFFTGRFTFPFRGWQRLEPKDVLLAETLWNQGITSALVTDVYHMHKPSMAFERGFDYTEHIRGHEGDPWITDPSIDVSERLEAVHKSMPKDSAVKAQIAQYLRNVHWWKSEEDTFVARTLKAGASWLERQPRKDNLFLWVDCFDPHEPWDPPHPYRDMYTDPNYKGKDIIQPIPGPADGYLEPEELQHIKNLYAGKISLCDKWIGWFLDKLKEMGLYDNTMIVFTTDHGEPFNEHGFIKKAQPGLYEELAHIPLLIRHPEGIGAGCQYDAMVETTEVFPTILEAFGVKAPGRIHGKSLLPMMRGEEDKVRDYAYMGYFKQSWRVTDQEWSFHMSLMGKPNELYNLKSDPMEQVNLVEKEPVKALEMELELRKFVANLK